MHAGTVFVFVVLMAGILSGCVGHRAPPSYVIEQDESYVGRTLAVEKGDLDIRDGACLRMTGGTLRFGVDPKVVVEAVVDVRGCMELDGTQIQGMAALDLHPSGRLVLRNVTLATGPTQPTMRLNSLDVTIEDSVLPVSSVSLTGGGMIQGNNFTFETSKPGLVWTGGALVFRNNEVHAPGNGLVVIDGRLGIIENNDIRAGTESSQSAIVLRSGNMRVENNTIRGGGTGILVADARATVSGNELVGPSRFGVIVQGSNVTMRNNTIRNGDTGFALSTSKGLMADNQIEEMAGTGVQAVASSIAIEATTIRNASIGYGLFDHTGAVGKASIVSGTTRQAAVVQGGSFPLAGVEFLNAQQGIVAVGAALRLGPDVRFVDINGTALEATGGVVQVSDVEIERARAGIKMDFVAWPSMISNSVIKQTRSFAISVAVANVTISDNLIDGGITTGIRLTQTTAGLLVQGNTIRGISNASTSVMFSESGIHVEGAVVVVQGAASGWPWIKGNEITGNDLGVLVIDPAKPRINQNQFAASRFFGIFRLPDPANPTTCPEIAGGLINARGNTYDGGPAPTQAKCPYQAGANTGTTDQVSEGVGWEPEEVPTGLPPPP